MFSPEVAPSATTTSTGNGDDDDNGRQSHHADSASVAAAVQPEHDLAGSAPRTSTWRCRPRSCGSSRATRTRSSSPSRSCAAPKGTKLTLNLGDEIPIVSTSYTPIATGGVGVNPLNSFSYRTGRHQHRHHAARHARRRHPDRAERREQRAGPTSTSPARTIRRSVAQGARRGCGCATASRTCWPACCVRTSGKS